MEIFKQDRGYILAVIGMAWQLQHAELQNNIS